MSTALPGDLELELLARENVPLGPLTTLGVGGPAPWVLEPRRREQLILAVRELHAAGMEWRVLGHGSNLLVRDAGVPEVVLHTRSLRHIYHEGEREHALRCEAGAPLSRLVTMAREQGLAGAEMLVGIPGTVGGAVIGNSGSRHGWISELLVEVTVVDVDGCARAVPVTPEDFGYRSSPFAGQVVVDAVVQLKPEPPAVIRARTEEILRAKAASQPLAARSAGCMFRNPPGQASGQLLDALGCKGWSEGPAEVSERHANFVVNRGGARADEVLALIERVRAAVRAEHQVELELEVEIW
ncbi:MAG: UDP-N-acetylenolpyruvoylglucosamine reductase [Planctomycetota bacterium]|nr:MAG: UDP-N-acetylenolpyruvoylglucosamine reductase [Planctomycetota bacterium]